RGHYIKRDTTLLVGSADGGEIGSATGAAEQMSASSHAGKPTVMGPITGGQHRRPFGSYFGDINSRGYVETEYFIEGLATRYRPVGELQGDGRWSVEPTESAPYKTRI